MTFLLKVPPRENKVERGWEGGGFQEEEAERERGGVFFIQARKACIKYGNFT